MKILIASHTRSSSLYQVGAHQLAKAWSQQAHEVWFLSPPDSSITLLKWALDKKSRSDGTLNKTNLAHVKALLLISLLPLTLLGALSPAWNRFFGRFLLPRPSSPALPSAVDLLILDHPGYAFLMKRIRHRSVAYRVTDIYPSMPSGRWLSSRLERWLATRVDHIICTSAPVRQHIEQYGQISPAKLKVVENGVDYHHFALKHECNTKTASHPFEQAILYYGAVDARFDLELCVEVARTCLNSPVVVASPEFDTQRGRSLIAELRQNKGPLPSNLHLLPGIDYGHLPKIVNQCRMGFLPWVRGRANDGRSPMKLYEFAAAQKCVVAMTTSELRRRQDPFVVLTENAKQFIAEISALDRSDERRTVCAANAMATAQSRSWEKVAKTVLDVCCRKLREPA